MLNKNRFVPNRGCIKYPHFSAVRLKKLQEEFVTDPNIGATVGITRSAVCQLRKKYGIESLGVKLRNEKIKTVISLWKLKLSTKAIADKTGYSISYINQIIRAEIYRKLAYIKAER